MENAFDCDVDGELVELDREESLVRLYELVSRLEAGALARGDHLTCAGRHRALSGHRLAFGCCAGLDAPAFGD